MLIPIQLIRLSITMSTNTTTSLKRKAEETESDGEESRSNKKPKTFDLYKIIERAKILLLEEHKNDIHGPIDLKVLKSETSFNPDDEVTDTYVYLYNYYSEAKLFGLGCVCFLESSDDDGEVIEFNSYDLNYFNQEVRATADPLVLSHFPDYEENFRLILSAEYYVKIEKVRTKHLENCIYPHIYENNLPLVFLKKKKDFVCPFCLASVDIVFK